MNLIRFLGLSVGAGVVAMPVRGCDLCSIYSAAQAEGEIGMGVYAGVAEQFSHFGTLQLDGKKVANEVGQYLDSSISQLYVGYNFNDHFGLQFNLPIIDRSFKRPAGAAIDRGSESGLGDVSLIGNFLVYRKLQENFTFSWTVLGGVKLPTGNSGRLQEEWNEEAAPGAPPSGIHGHDLALGTGSFDGIVGTAAFTRWRKLFLTANVQYAIRSKGDFDYQFADDLTWSSGPGVYLLLSHDYTLALQAILSGEHKAQDTFQGKPSDDTGVTAVYLGPQLSFTWSSKFSAQLGVDFPVSMDNTALQTVRDYRFRGGLTWHF